MHVLRRCGNHWLLEETSCAFPKSGPMTDGNRGEMNHNLRLLQALGRGILCNDMSDRAAVQIIRAGSSSQLTGQTAPTKTHSSTSEAIQFQICSTFQVFARRSYCEPQHTATPVYKLQRVIEQSQRCKWTPCSQRALHAHIVLVVLVRAPFSQVLRSKQQSVARNIERNGQNQTGLAGSNFMQTEFASHMLVENTAQVPIAKVQTSAPQLRSPLEADVPQSTFFGVQVSHSEIQIKTAERDRSQLEIML